MAGRAPRPPGGWRGALGRLREAAWPAGLPPPGAPAPPGAAGPGPRGGGQAPRSLRERSALLGEAFARYRASWGRGAAEGAAEGGAAGGSGRGPGAGGSAAGGGRLSDELGEAARALAREGARGLGPILRKASRERLGTLAAGLREFVAGYREGLAEGPAPAARAPPEGGAGGGGGSAEAGGGGQERAGGGGAPTALIDRLNESSRERTGGDRPRPPGAAQDRKRPWAGPLASLQSSL